MAKDVVKSLNKRNCKKLGLVYHEANSWHKESYWYYVNNHFICSLKQEEKPNSVSLVCEVNQSYFGLDENPYAVSWQEQVNKLFEKFQNVPEIDRQELANALQTVIAYLNDEWQKYNQDQVKAITAKYEADLAKIKEQAENPWFLKK